MGDSLLKQMHAVTGQPCHDAFYEYPKDAEAIKDAAKELEKPQSFF